MGAHAAPAAAARRGEAGEPLRYRVLSVLFVRFADAEVVRPGLAAVSVRR